MKKLWKHVWEVVHVGFVESGAGHLQQNNDPTHPFFIINVSMTNTLEVLDPVIVKTPETGRLEGVVACIDEKEGTVGIRLTGTSVGKGNVAGGTMGELVISNNNGIYCDTSSATKRRLTKLEELRLRRELAMSSKQKMGSPRTPPNKLQQQEQSMPKPAATSPSKPPTMSSPASKPTIVSRESNKEASTKAAVSATRTPPLPPTPPTIVSRESSRDASTKAAVSEIGTPPLPPTPPTIVSRESSRDASTKAAVSEIGTPPLPPTPPTIVSRESSKEASTKATVSETRPPPPPPTPPAIFSSESSKEASTKATVSATRTPPPPPTRIPAKPATKLVPPSKLPTRTVTRSPLSKLPATKIPKPSSTRSPGSKLPVFKPQSKSRSVRPPTPTAKEPVAKSFATKATTKPSISAAPEPKSSIRPPTKFATKVPATRAEIGESSYSSPQTRNRSLHTSTSSSSSVDPPGSDFSSLNISNSFDGSVFSTPTSRSSGLSQSHKIARSSPRQESTPNRSVQLRTPEPSPRSTTGSTTGKSDPPGKTSVSLFVGGLHSWAGVESPSFSTTSSRKSSSLSPRQQQQCTFQPSSPIRPLHYKQEGPGSSKSCIELNNSPRQRSSSSPRQQRQECTFQPSSPIRPLHYEQEGPGASKSSFEPNNSQDGQEVTESSFYLNHHSLDKDPTIDDDDEEEEQFLNDDGPETFLSERSFDSSRDGQEVTDTSFYLANHALDKDPTLPEPQPLADDPEDSSSSSNDNEPEMTETSLDLNDQSSLDSLDKEPVIFQDDDDSEQPLNDDGPGTSLSERSFDSSRDGQEVTDTSFYLANHALDGDPRLPEPQPLEDGPGDSGSSSRRDDDGPEATDMSLSLDDESSFSSSIEEPSPVEQVLDPWDRILLQSQGVVKVQPPPVPPPEPEVSLVDPWDLSFAAEQEESREGEIPANEEDGDNDKADATVPLLSPSVAGVSSTAAMLKRKTEPTPDKRGEATVAGNSTPAPQPSAVTADPSDCSLKQQDDATKEKARSARDKGRKPMPLFPKLLPAVAESNTAPVLEKGTKPSSLKEPEAAVAEEPLSGTQPPAVAVDSSDDGIGGKNSAIAPTSPPAESSRAKPSPATTAPESSTVKSSPACEESAGSATTAEEPPLASRWDRLLRKHAARRDSEKKAKTTVPTSPSPPPLKVQPRDRAIVSSRSKGTAEPSPIREHEATVTRADPWDVSFTEQDPELEEENGERDDDNEEEGIAVMPTSSSPPPSPKLPIGVESAATAEPTSGLEAAAAVSLVDPWDLSFAAEDPRHENPARDGSETETKATVLALPPPSPSNLPATDRKIESIPPKGAKSAVSAEPTSIPHPPPADPLVDPWKQEEESVERDDSREKSILTSPSTPPNLRNTDLAIESIASKAAEPTVTSQPKPIPPPPAAVPLVDPWDLSFAKHDPKRKEEIPTSDGSGKKTETAIATPAPLNLCSTDWAVESIPPKITEPGVTAETKSLPPPPAAVPLVDPWDLSFSKQNSKQEEENPAREDGSMATTAAAVVSKARSECDGEMVNKCPTEKHTETEHRSAIHLQRSWDTTSATRPIIIATEKAKSLKQVRAATGETGNIATRANEGSHTSSGTEAANAKGNSGRGKQAELQNESKRQTELQRSWNAPPQYTQQETKNVEDEEDTKSKLSLLRGPWNKLIPWGLGGRTSPQAPSTSSSTEETGRREHHTTSQQTSFPSTTAKTVDTVACGSKEGEVNENSAATWDKTNSAALKEAVPEADVYRGRKGESNTLFAAKSMGSESIETEASTVTSIDERGIEVVYSNSTDGAESNAPMATSPIETNSTRLQSYFEEGPDTSSACCDTQLSENRPFDEEQCQQSLPQVNQPLPYGRGSTQDSHQEEKKEEAFESGRIRDNEAGVPTSTPFSSLHPLPINADRPLLNLRHPWDRVLDRLTDETDDFKRPRNATSTPTNKARYSTLDSPEVVIFVDQSTSTSSSTKMARNYLSNIMDTEEVASHPSMETCSIDGSVSLKDHVEAKQPRNDFIETDKIDGQSTGGNEVSPGAVMKAALMHHSRKFISESSAPSNDSYSTSSLAQPPSPLSTKSGNGENLLLFSLDETAITMDGTTDGLDFTTCLPLMVALNDDKMKESFNKSFMESYTSMEEENALIDRAEKDEQNEAIYQFPYMSPAPKDLYWNNRHAPGEAHDSHTHVSADLDSIREIRIEADELSSGPVKIYSIPGPGSKCENADLDAFKEITEEGEQIPQFIDCDSISESTSIAKENTSIGSTLDSSFGYTKPSHASYSWTLPSMVPPGSKIQENRIFQQDQFDVESPPSATLDKSLHSLDSMPSTPSVRNFLELGKAGEIKEVKPAAAVDWQPTRNGTSRITSITPLPSTRRFFVRESSWNSDGSDSVSGKQTDFQPRSAQRKKAKTRRLLCWFVVLVGVLAGAGLGLTYGVWYRNSDSKGRSKENELLNQQRENTRILADKLGVTDQLQDSSHVKVAIEWMAGANEYAYNINLSERELEERFALVTLYTTTGTENVWALAYSFLSPQTSVCNWNADGKGVFCGENGLVTEINLNDNGLSGSLPSEISRLSNLESLSLGSNTLNGRIPTSLGDLQHLYSLNLSDNQLTGEMPDRMGASLQIINLSYNSELEGTIPPEMTQLPHLAHLSLFGTNLDGTIPDFSNQQSISFVAIGRSSISGTIPSSLTLLPNLRYLYLIDNHLSGPVPTNFSTLDGNKMQQMYISGNQLTGSIPSALQNLTGLRQLGLDFNQLTGSIPTTLSRLAGLKRLYLNHNEDLTGEIQSSSMPTLLSNLQVLQIQNTGLESGDDSLCTSRTSGNAWTFLASDCMSSSNRVVCTCCTVCCTDGSSSTEDNTCRAFTPSGGGILENAI